MDITNDDAELGVKKVGPTCALGMDLYAFSDRISETLGVCIGA